MKDGDGETRRQGHARGDDPAEEPPEYSGSSSSSDDGEDLGLGRNSDGNESDVDGEFEFFDPNEDDVPRIRELLLAHFTANTPASVPTLQAHDIATAIVSQKRVGSTIRVSEDSEALGFVTILNVCRHRRLLAPLLECVRKGKAAPSNRQADGNVVEFVASRLEKRLQSEEHGRCGLLVFERVVNLPITLVPWVQEAIFEEVGWAVEDEPTKEDRESYRFTELIYTTDVFFAETGDGGGSRRKKKRRRRTSGNSDVQMMFERPEDEVYFGAAEASVTWPIQGDQVGPGGLIRRRMLMWIPFSAVPDIRAQTRTLLPPPPRLDD